MQTVFYDPNGWVKCAEDGESTATVRGCEKATSDPSVHGELTIRHTVTVSDGEVTDAVYHAPPPPTDAEWYDRIEKRADQELKRGEQFTASDGVTYTVRTGETALALIGSAHSAAERADRLGKAITRKVPTQNHGVVAFGNADIVSIFDAVENRHQSCMTRVQELHAMVADGTITEADLETGWPA